MFCEVTCTTMAELQGNQREGTQCKPAGLGLINQCDVLPSVKKHGSSWVITLATVRRWIWQREMGWCAEIARVVTRE